MKPIPDDPLLAAIVAAADRGAVHLSTVVFLVRQVGRRLGAEREEVRAPVLATLREALRRRALVVGTMVDGELEPWHVSADDAVARIEREWSELGRDPRHAEIATFGTIDSIGFA